MDPWTVGLAAVPLRILRCRRKASVEAPPIATTRPAATVSTTSAPVASQTFWNEPPPRSAAWKVIVVPVKLSGTARPVTSNPSVSISGETLARRDGDRDGAGAPRTDLDGLAHRGF